MEQTGEEGNAGGGMSLYACNKRKTCGVKWGCYAGEPHEQTRVCSRIRSCPYNDALLRRCVPVKAKRGAAANSAKVAAFESAITPHILRHWSRERIVTHAKHLLGDECQGCEKCGAKTSKEREM